ncbi:hypothetical protein LXL04_025274 [Taraxacum kok-saghyz]
MNKNTARSLTVDIRVALTEPLYNIDRSDKGREIDSCWEQLMGDFIGIPKGRVCPVKELEPGALLGGGGGGGGSMAYLGYAVWCQNGVEEAHVEGFHGVEGRRTPPRAVLACTGVGTPTRENGVNA